MSAEADFSKQFYENSQKFFSERVEYASVTALLLYWEENDISPEQEVNTFRELLEHEFGFASITFLIPSHRAQQELNRQVSAFIADYSSQVDSLVLVYYAGHGDVDDKGKSIWAANVEGGPTLSWWKAQQLLYDAVGGVLTILDCCSAALASKGDKEGGKFEILGASAKGLRTPEPGHSSFTTILIKHIRKSLKRNHQINARSLHGELLESSQLTETPQYADLARSNPRSIVLQPLRPLQHEGFVKKPSSFLMLKVSLAEDPTGMRIAEWLKTHPPEGVTAVSVEAMILKARKLQGLVDHTAFPPGSTFGRLSESAQRELLDRLQCLDTVIHSADRSAQISPLTAENAAVSESLKAIDQSVNAVCKAVETPILLDPYFSDRAGLQQARDEIAKTAGTEEAISLRQRLLGISATPDHLEIQGNALYFNSHTGESAATCRFRTGRLGDHTVLMEWFPYQDWDGDVESDNLLPPKWEIERVERTTAFLCQPKNDSFHILPCMGYLSEPLNRGFNLVFERPGKGKKDAEPIALGQMYKIARIVPLGHRIQLAYELISTLENFHRVGWVHKNISSHNIMFLPQDPHSLPIPTSLRIEKLEDGARTDPDRVDLASPWLFGYEASRPDNIDSSLQEDYSLGNNIYHHPARWGKPSMSFTKAQDVYTLGIVLLEIAFWKDILSIAEIPRPDASYRTYPVVPEKIQARLVAKCSRTLPHQVGQVFTDTIVACLDFERETKEMTAYDQHRYYETNVVDGMVKIVGRI